MSHDSSAATLPSPATLNDPLYYLRNARQVIHWCLRVYPELLQSEEIQQLNTLLELPETAQCLLVRLIMRKGVLFRSDNLNYREIGTGNNLMTPLQQLAHSGLLVLDPHISLVELTQLCRKPEALTMLRHCAPDAELLAKHSKQHLLAFAEHFFEYHHKSARFNKIHDWWPDAPFQLIKLSSRPLFDRIRLMFFGNMYQSWSEFVLAELGIQKYESVAFTAESRAFKQRQEVDIYLALYQIQEQLEFLKANTYPSDTGAEAAEQLALQLERLAADHKVFLLKTGENSSEWLQRRYHKTCFQLGYHAERSGLDELALNCYRNSESDDAVIRRFRLTEKKIKGEAGYERLYGDLLAAIDSSVKPEQKLLLNRILKRVAHKLNLTVKPAKNIPLIESTLTLPPDHSRSVEPVLVDCLTAQGEIAFHVESRLINGLFSLLFWPVLFDPVPGAFFNPFQSGPADLYRADFYTARQKQIDDTFDRLRQSEAYKRDIRNCYQEKLGTSCSLMHWATINETLLELSLELIPAEHLEALFRHLLLDLRHHRKGLPDLVVFNPQEQSYRFIEVKAPGDRLQDHQRLWLEQMQKDGIPAEVLYVRWSDS